ncbi:MAG: Rrf2 family nitric oxide-sensitive transcriptional repressor [Myxococcota bacterium]|jgi:Rrf2 family nitric oxide-sensitive transcriptional repressor
MQLTDHTDYGLRVLILLAAVAPQRLSSLDLAGRHGLSHAHVQKVVQSLQNAGFVQTFRGRGGGVQLARLPSDIRVGEVVRALEPHLDFVECFRPGHSRCKLDGGCALTQTLVRAKSAMLVELDKTTIAGIVQGSPAIQPLLG